MQNFITPFNRLRKKDFNLVGGKTASLGELISIGMPVPDGFAITANAFRYFIKKNNLEEKIRSIIKTYNLKDINQLKRAGSKIRKMIMNAEIPDNLKKEILYAFKKLNEKYVAVRSSATLEDMPDASFAGQQETFLNTCEKDLLKRVKQCFASLYTNRAISYREDKGFDHFNVALSVAIQKQIFSESSGVMFTIEPDSGHKNLIVINAGFGLGDYIVQGKIIPDEFLIFKKTCKLIEKRLGKKAIMEIRSKRGVKTKKLSRAMQERFSIEDHEAEELARLGVKIEKHYNQAMDIEWAKENGKLYILQARPETVHSTKKNAYEKYKLIGISNFFLEGTAIGRKIATGKANVIRSVKDIHKFREGEILVTGQTNPDWEPIMKIAKGIVTEEGGRTSHCAIVSRELGIPAVIGVKDAMKIFKTGEEITVDCSQNVGRVWRGALKFSVSSCSIKKIPKTKTKVFVNIGIPDEAIDISMLPIDGIGLVREEFIISSFVREHPLKLIREGKEKVFVDALCSGIAKIAACFYPREVIVRFSDFKTNEYKALIGGEEFEPNEENPMLGWRGASRYISNIYERAFRLEIKAMKKAVEGLGLNNIKVMIPFCRTLEEAKEVLKIIRSEKLKTEVYVMAEIPSNIILADGFSKLFDGFSIGSNDLTQLTLGVDRDNKILANKFDERNEAVKRLIESLIKTAHKYNRKVGICGDAPSTHKGYAEFLIKCGIDSISVTPDVAVETKLRVAKIEKKLGLSRDSAK
ncbi:MAG: phosphoenolpyruvate synthase [Candidatus Aenigmatarchaeota archaeon]